MWSSGNMTFEQVSGAFTMLVIVLLVMLRGLGGAAVSDIQVFGESVHNDKLLLRSVHGQLMMKKLPQQQMRSGNRRSLDLESINVHMRPTPSKISRPTFVKLYPPTAKPLSQHANMPLRFGRDSDLGDDRSPNRTPNMPQRFGRSWEVIRMCAECPDVQIPEGSGIPESSTFWSLLRTLVNAQSERALG